MIVKFVLNLVLLFGTLKYKKHLIAIGHYYESPPNTNIVDTTASCNSYRCLTRFGWIYSEDMCDNEKTKNDHEKWMNKESTYGDSPLFKALKINNLYIFKKKKKKKKVLNKNNVKIISCPIKIMPTLMKF